MKNTLKVKQNPFHQYLLIPPGPHSRTNISTRHVFATEYACQICISPASAREIDCYGGWMRDMLTIATVTVVPFLFTHHLYFDVLIQAEPARISERALQF